jgi:DNA polymerase III subunit gamma/tau
MSNSPPSQRDRRSLQDLAKLASSPSMAPLSTKTPPPPVVTEKDPDHDSGIVDLKMIAQQDEGAEERAKMTPLASSPLFDDDPADANVPSGPVSAPPSSQMKGQTNGPVSGPASSRRAPPSTASGPNPRASAVAVAAGTAADSEKKGSMVWVLGGLGLVVAAAGTLFFMHGSTTQPTADHTAQATTAAPPVAAASPGSSAPANASPSQVASSAASPDNAGATAAADPAPSPDVTIPARRASAGGGGGRRAPASSKAAPPIEGAGGSGVSPLSAMMAQAATNTPAPPPAAPGALGEAVEHAVGGAGAPAAASEPSGPAGPSFAPGSVPDRPSQGAVSGAIGRALPEARACLNPDDPVSRATVTFASEGSVSSVVVMGSAAGKPVEACIKSALLKAHVPPFAQATYSATIPVRPN